jgi:predicted DsbA family dithiol-disulfide isomerase
LRQSFFVETRDIGQLAIVLDVASEAGLDRQQLKELIDNGEAMAALMTDLRLAQDQAVMGSPTWIMNQGRQVLYGNVGYRVLHANIEEILKRPLQEASWC